MDAGSIRPMGNGARIAGFQSTLTLGWRLSNFEPRNGEEWIRTILCD